MPSELFAVCFAAQQPKQLARFWSALLDWSPTDGATLLPTQEVGFRISFVPTQEPKADLNRVHLDLTSASVEDQQRRVAMALGLGGRHFDVGQRPEEAHVVLADPEGNEFCVIEPGNSFLAGCGLVGALSCDGTQAVGYFWSEALGWPLVWDQDQETAIQAPHGGPKITWGGPPLNTRKSRDRLRFDLVTTGGGSLHAEANRLVSLGATLTAAAEDADHLELADPDGCLFRVLPGPHAGEDDVRRQAEWRAHREAMDAFVAGLIGLPRSEALQLCADADLDVRLLDWDELGHRRIALTSEYRANRVTLHVQRGRVTEGVAG